MMIKLYRQLRQRFREKNLEKRMAYLRSGFKVKERGGILWLLLDGVAFYEIPHNFNADTIAGKIEESRNTAIKYDSLNLTEDEKR